ncbi:hypothetical protein Tco_0840676 [Tanacetum coccineum]|uniref:Uncharacterized protein n=1 Tax=Tanacetum coccineum TaxID=301880 RepID=A0ABQ5AW40_9ASTR
MFQKWQQTTGIYYIRYEEIDTHDCSLLNSNKLKMYRFKTDNGNENKEKKLVLPRFAPIMEKKHAINRLEGHPFVMRGFLEILKELGRSLGSSSRMISINNTSPSSYLEQINFALEDRGTNPSDSSIKFSFCTCSVAMEANGSGCRCGLELMFPRLPSSSCPTSDLLTWDSLGCLGWIVMVLIEL